MNKCPFCGAEPERHQSTLIEGIEYVCGTVAYGDGEDVPGEVCYERQIAALKERLIEAEVAKDGVELALQMATDRLKSLGEI